MTPHPKRILLVCSGNTCRSPLAAALLAARLATTTDLADIVVESAGTGARDGEPASEGSSVVALEYGIDLAAHRSRMISADMVQHSDLILAMSSAHLRHVIALGGAESVHLLTAFAGESGADVADPFGGGIATYRDAARQLDRLLASVVARLQAPAQP
jgi:protein-tyrosine-phosphatase